MKKVVIMSRVNTTDQKEKSYSLQQEMSLRDFCQRNNYSIEKYYEEDYSAKDFNRPQFNQFLKDVDNGIIQVDYIVFTKMDRFSRNLEESMKMLKFLNQKGVKLLLVKSCIHSNNSEDISFELFSLLMPQIENKRISIRISAGMRQAQKEGRWIGKAPLGYEYNCIDKKPKSIFPDENASIIIYIFEEYVKGIYSFEDVRIKVKQHFNRNIPKATVKKIIENNVYCGEININATIIEPKKTITGRHKPLITKALFYQAQKINR